MADVIRLELQIDDKGSYVVKTVAQDIENLGHKAETAASGPVKLQESTERLSNSLRSAAGLATGLAAALGIGGLTTIFVGAARAGLDMNATLERTELQFRTLLGSAELAKAHVRDLFDFAARTPFETGPIIEASRMLLVFGGQALATRESLTLVGDAAAVASRSINEVAFWVGRAYSMIEAGKPFGEAAMRLQEMGILSGVARDRIEQLQASGASATVVWGEFRQELGRFKGAMEAQAETWGGLTSTIRDNVNLALATGFQPMFVGLKTLAQETAAFVQTEEFTRWVRGAGDVLSTVLPPALHYSIAGLRAFGTVVAAEAAGVLTLTNAVLGLSLGVHSGGLWIRELLGIQSSLGVSTEAVREKVAQLSRDIEANRETIARLSRTMYDLTFSPAPAFVDGFRTAINKARTAVEDVRPPVQRGAQDLRSFATGMRDVAQATDATKPPVEDLALSFRGGSEDLRTFATGMDALTGASGSVATGMRDVAQATDATKPPVEDLALAFRGGSEDLRTFATGMHVVTGASESTWEAIEQTEAKLDALAPAFSKTSITMLDYQNRLGQIRLESQLLGDEFDSQQAELLATKDAMLGLLREGVDPSDVRIQALVQRYRTLREIMRLEGVAQAQAGELTKATASLWNFRGIVEDAFRGVNTGISTSIRGVIQGTQSLEDAFARAGQNIALGLVDSIVNRGLKAVEKALLDFVFEGVNPFGALVGGGGTGGGGGAAGGGGGILSPVISAIGAIKGLASGVAGFSAAGAAGALDSILGITALSNTLTGGSAMVGSFGGLFPSLATSGITQAGASITAANLAADLAAVGTGAAAGATAGAVPASAAAYDAALVSMGAGSGAGAGAGLAGLVPYAGPAAAAAGVLYGAYGLLSGSFDEASDAKKREFAGKAQYELALQGGQEGMAAAIRNAIASGYDLHGMTDTVAAYYAYEDMARGTPRAYLAPAPGWVAGKYPDVMDAIYKWAGIDPNNPLAIGFADTGRAEGGPVWPGLVTHVGERGPEPVVFGRAGYVLSHQEARDIYRESVGGGGGGGVTLIVNIDARGSLADGRTLSEFVRDKIKPELAELDRLRHGPGWSRR